MASIVRKTILAGAVAACLTGIVSAQTTSTSTETKKFEVIAVEGNHLVVKLPEGTRDITVPAGFMFTVDGKQLSVGQLKPGMAGTATITKTTTVTPVTVTEVKNGTVMQTAGSSIIVRTDEGYKMFTEGDVEKRGVKIMRNGQPAALSSFRSGDQLSAVIITEKPPRVVTEQEVKATLAASGAGTGTGAAGTSRAAAAGTTGAAGAGGATGAAGAGGASGAASGAGTGAGAGASRGRSLPKTASPLPLLGLVGGLSLFAGAALTLRRLFNR
jgi:hypothetical protein